MIIDRRAFRRPLFGVGLALPLLLSSVSVRADAPAGGLAQLVAAAKPAVVFIVGSTNRGAQSGTGFVVRSDGSSSTIITANHVIEGSQEVDVIFDSDEHERYTARIVKRDHHSDVAVLTVPVAHRPTLLLESPKDLAEGTSIVLIGYPVTSLIFHRIQGDALRPTIHTGIISAIRLNGEVIQFDAAAYHGDSGGPVIDVGTGRVVAIVHGPEVDPNWAAHGIEQQLPGSVFGPSTSLISAALSGAPRSAETPTEAAFHGNGSGQSSAVASDVNTSAASLTAGVARPAESGAHSESAAYRVGYGVWTPTNTTGNAETVSEVNQSVQSSVLSRLQTYLQADNGLYLVPVDLAHADITDMDHLTGYCADNRLNSLIVPALSWRLTGGPRYNGYGTLMGYSGAAGVEMELIVIDCYGYPFFIESKTKTENRYFAHRAPDREIVDMANDLLDQLTTDLSNSRSTKAAIWANMLKNGISIDPNSDAYHSMVNFAKKPAGITVTVVTPGGPGDQAGIRVQDVIEKVNGLDASGMTSDDLKAQMNQPQVTFDLQRPGGNVSVTVHPVKYTELVQLLSH